MNTENILMNKHGFTFSSTEINNYKISFDMKNTSVIMSDIINFSTIRLIYDLNTDIYDKIKMDHINENEVVTTLLMKHFFQDLGLPQRFSHIIMKKNVEDEHIIFKGQSITTRRPECMPTESELLPIKDFNCNCHIVTPHLIHFEIDIIFDKTMNIPSFVEKMIGIVLYKIFTRVKQFIENIRM